MNPDSLTKHIFVFFLKNKTKPNWFMEVVNDFRELQITKVMLQGIVTNDKTYEDLGLKLLENRFRYQWREIGEDQI